MNITSSLSPEIISRLNDYSKKFRIPKSRILEQALEAYFERISKAELIRTFKAASRDEEILLMAEEGLEEYLKILDNETT
ncbi:MAG: ribbon-helix-helix domain-containing protein [Prolixibacteraceae bacterium]|jgi:predicted transcriptional regulator|nr:ribbon-helix-helix domain-containing protein [Prolixibacteraceae bacterium]MDI9563435.1 ribbon-helix-helix domain-containing protein [Bacteroidota bacterium]NLS98553.1 ribbon-helix-helix domain-containing protein [Bacteroidales bacterium]OQB80268.1 MAG: Ribbon-helix-helix domain protein [Bacteroidetes bacterium ADurb.Bin123]HNU77846.1 ribbon-helix-helix domain-containing protein [Prolixibacteraceae bacterium]